MIRHSPERATHAADVEIAAPPEASNRDDDIDKGVSMVSNAVKIPPPLMDTGNLEGFFLAVEYWFAASGITATQDSKRFNFIMAQVPQKALVELKAKFEMLPATGKYEFAKTTLTAHYSESQQRRMQRVLSEMALGDAKPSQLYYDMRRVANGSISDELLLDLWATRLPANIQHLVVANQGPVNEKVAIADAVMESQRWRPINAISSATPRGAPTDHAPPRNDPQCSHAKCLDAWRDVRQYLHSIKNTLQDIQSTMRVTTPDRSPTARTRRYSTTSDSSTGTQRTAPSANRATNDVCWYHEKHGVRATKCRSPCSFKAKPNQP